MVKKIKINRPNLLVNYYIDIGIQACANILVVAFLVCIILYISKINTLDIIDDNDAISCVSVPAGNIQKTMKNFINIMAWIMICVIGLSAFISVV